MAKEKSEVVVEKQVEVGAYNVKELIEKDKRERVGKCNEEVNNILTKYDCYLDMTMLLRQNQITPVINIVAR